ncbi:aquaporin [Phytoactinopolyspora halophila]|nr:aquaporin [Phytoactinopolyspora halophila]
MWVRNAVAEGIGTFALTLVAVLSMTSNQVAPYALAQGLTVLVMVAALGHVCGGHFNPAVTLALFLGKRIDVVGATIYWAAQLIGGIVAALVVLFTTSRDLVASGVPGPASGGEINVVGALVLEAFVVVVLVLAVFGTIVDPRAPLSVYPFAVGLAYAGGILAIGDLTGGALNPARAFGPAVVGGEWSGIASWLVGPLLGAAIAWLIYEFVIGADDDTAAADVDEAEPEPAAVASATAPASMTAPAMGAATVSSGAGEEAGTRPQSATEKVADGGTAPEDPGEGGDANEADHADHAEADAAEEAEQPASSGREAKQPPPPPSENQDLPPEHRGLLDQ